MPQFEKARRNMVDCQLRTCEVTSLPVLAAFDTVPRELFVPAALRDQAYLDRVIPLGGRDLVTPMTFGRLVHIAQVTRTDKVLDVACGLGYSTAILAHIAGTVIGIESDAALAGQGEAILRSLALANASIRQSALTEVPKGEGPFDVVVINGAFEEVPEAFLPAVVDGGRLVGVSVRGGAGRAVVLTKNDGAWSERAYYNAAAPMIQEFRRAPAFTF